MRMVTFLQERPSSLPRGTGWVRWPWLKRASSGSRMGRTGAVSVMLEGPSGSVSAHALEPLPIRGQAFNSEPWKETVARTAEETEEGAGGALGGSGLGKRRVWGQAGCLPTPVPTSVSNLYW